MERYIQGKKFILIADNTRKQSKTFKKRRDYFMRLKVHKKDSKRAFIKFLNRDVNHVESYQVALEGDNETNWHIQAVIKFEEKYRKMMDECFRDSFKEWYDNGIKKKNKINSYYSLGQIRENSLRALAYNFKEDKDVVTWNVNAEDIRIARMLSHGKDLRQLSKQMEDLKEEYFKTNDGTGEKKLITKMILLKAEFNQSIYLNRIEAEARYIMVKKNPKYAETMSSKICEKIFGD